MNNTDSPRPANASAEWTPAMQEALETAVGKITRRMLDDLFMLGRHPKASEVTIDGTFTVVPPPMLPAPSEPD